MALTTITNAMVSVNAIQGTLIADNAITAVHIATNAVSGTLVADNAITATHIAQNTITVTQIADDAIESAKIADGIITTNHLNKAMISSQTEVTAVAGDFVLIGDTSDSNNLKKAPISSILAGTLTTAAQTNITSVGTLTSFRSTGIDDNADALAMTITSDENLYIGQTASSGVRGIDNKVQVSGTDLASSSLALHRYQAGAYGPYLHFGKSRHGTVGSHTIVQDGDVVGSLGFYPSDGSDFVGHCAEIVVQVDGTPGTDDIPGRILFKTTADGAVSSTERMRIDSSGNVGIGTSSPQELLHLTATTPVFRLEGGSRTYQQFVDSTSFYIRDVTAGANRVILDSSGNLSVAGTVTQSTAKTAQFTGQYDGRETTTITLGSLGFKPQVLFCIFNVGTTQKASWGMAARDGGHQVLLDYDAQAAGDGYEASSSYFGRLAKGSSAFSNLAVSAWNSDNVVIQKSISNGGSAATCVYRITVMG